jgi:hypothetical protein
VIWLLSACAPTAAPALPLTFTTADRALEAQQIVEVAVAPTDRAMPAIAWRAPASVGGRALHSRLSTLGPPLALPPATDLDLSRLAGGAVLAVVDAAGLTLHRLDGRGEPMQAPLPVAPNAAAAAVHGLPSGAVRVVWTDAAGTLRGLAIASMITPDVSAPILLAAGPAAGPAVVSTSDGGAWIAWSEAGQLRAARWRDDATTPIDGLSGAIVGAPSIVDGAVAWSDGDACWLAAPDRPAVRLDTAGCGHVGLAAAGTSLFAAWEERATPSSIRLQQRGLDLSPIGEPLTPPSAPPPDAPAPRVTLPAVAAWITRDGVEGGVAWAADGVPHLRGWRLGGEPRVEAPPVAPPPLPQPGPRP